jgi:hypothetical protein
MPLPEYRLHKLKADMEPREFARARAPAEVLRIDRYPWAGARGPLTEVRGVHTDSFCYLAFRVFENEPVVRHHSFQDPVYEDSCVEFFFNPFPESSNDYVNLEINAAGVLLAQIGSGRRERRWLAAAEVQELQIWSSQDKLPSGARAVEDWAVGLKIPFAFFSVLYGRSLALPFKARGNFYKCGDRTGRPHYGCWSPVQCPAPDFHQPAYFGALVFA